MLAVAQAEIASARGSTIMARAKQVMQQIVSAQLIYMCDGVKTNARASVCARTASSLLAHMSWYSESTVSKACLKRDTAAISKPKLGRSDSVLSSRSTKKHGRW